MTGAIVGLVLAGGRSTRFGSDKALALYGGQTLAEHARHKLEAVAQEIAVNTAPRSPLAKFAEARGWSIAPDNPADPPSPLAGIRAGLAWAAAHNAALLATAPCDAPLMPDDLFPRLVAALESSGAPVACPRTPVAMHPLAAVWRLDLLGRIEAALAHQKHPPLRVLIAEWGAAFVDFPDDLPFANINTPADLAHLPKP